MVCLNSNGIIEPAESGGALLPAFFAPLYCAPSALRSSAFAGENAMGDENRMSADQVLQGLGGRGVVVDLGEPEYLVLSQGEKTISVLMEPLDDDVLESIMERAEKVQSGDLKAHAGLVTDLLHDVLDLESISDDEREMILGAGIVAKYRIVGAVQEYLCQGVEDAVRKNPSVARARRGQGRRG